ncbi:MAG: hypothetical protein RLZZ618_3896 [Pseudomonadota bacterium]|jgi:thioredoxin 2
MLIACPHCHATNRVPDERLLDDPVCGRCGKAVLSGEAITLTDQNFEAFTRSTELPVIVDFWAPWCGPCQMMAPQFAQAARTLKGRAVLAKINSDENPVLASRFAIRSIPTLLLLQAGKEAKRSAGAMQASQIVAWVAPR